MVVICKREQQILPCEKNVIALPVKTVGVLKSYSYPFKLVFLRIRVFGYNAKLSVKQPYMRVYADILIGNSIITARQIRCFATDDLKTYIQNIFLPGFSDRCWKRELFFVGSPSFLTRYIENIIFAKPSVINKVILFVADL